MGDLDDAMEAAHLGREQRSQIDAALAQLDEADARKLLEVYLPDRRYSAAQICRALQSLGIRVSRHAIADWRARHVPR
jgi:hypothetical protein